MKVTNIYNLPTALVEAVTTEKHNKDGEYSATTLLKSACETILTKRHWNEIIVDASESIWQIFGTATHSIFEAQKDNTFKEEFFSVDVSNSKVTGRVDSYDLENEILVDWKTASVWKVIKQDFADWKRQGLIYSWLIKKCGLNVKKCRFIALLKDHSKADARTKADYPKQPVYVYEFDVTAEDLADIEIFIESKVKEIEFADSLKDEELTPCTPEERWASAEQWAVKKVGTKKAIPGGVCNTLEDAQKLVEEKGGKGFEIEHREPTNRKCIDYCICKEKCSFYKSLHREPETGSVE